MFRRYIRISKVLLNIQMMHLRSYEISMEFSVYPHEEPFSEKSFVS